MKKEKSLAPSYADQQIVRPEAVHVLEILSKKYKLGIIANQPEGITEKLEHATILHYFENYTVSAHYKLTKPDPEYFKAAFRDTGSDPKTSGMVDDNIERALLPAKQLGMSTVWYKLRERTVPDGIDFKIDSLNDLLEIL